MGGREGGQEGGRGRRGGRDLPAGDQTSRGYGYCPPADCTPICISHSALLLWMGLLTRRALVDCMFGREREEANRPQLRPTPVHLNPHPPKTTTPKTPPSFLPPTPYPTLALSPAHTSRPAMLPTAPVWRATSRAALNPKRLSTGLYDGRSIMSGNAVGETFGNKTRRSWLPNVQTKAVWSEALGRSLRLKVTAGALRTIDKVGGLDAYLFRMKPDRLGEKGLVLRSLVSRRFCIFSSSSCSRLLRLMGRGYWVEK